MLIQVTERASRRIRALQGERGLPASAPLRLDVVGGAPSGLAYDLFFDEPLAGDVVVDAGGVTVLVRPDAAAHVGGVTLDWVETSNGAGFMVRPPATAGA